MSNGTVARHVDALVPPDRNIQNEDLKDLQQRGWTGQACTPESRAMYWRLCLGVVSRCQSRQWKRDLIDQVSDYRALQKEILPDISAMAQDPLSHMLSAGAVNEEEARVDGWDKYFEPKESLKLIVADLDRLYLSGVDDDFFQGQERRKMLENILFIWSARHESVSYRQGMHEIAGTVLLVVDKELEGWEADCANTEEDREISAHSLRGCFTKSNMEAFTFWIFEAIMKDLAPLYDPAVGADQQPAVVQYCTNIQENLLRHNDPELCDVLEGHFIQSQLYGMRWARLMLGREFKVTDAQVLRVWDYIFASCISLSKPVVDMLDPLSMDLLAHASSDQAEVLASRARYGPYNPLLAMLGNFMLAMLLHIREDLVSGDVSTALSLLMRYPATDDIGPIVDYADMIRRGVLDPGAHVGKVLEGGLLSADAAELMSPLSSSSQSATRKELKVRLREAANPMLSMGRRVSKLVSSGSGVQASSPSSAASDDQFFGTEEPRPNPPLENLSRTHGLFSSFTKGVKGQKQESGDSIDSLLSSSGVEKDKKKSLFQSSSKKEINSAAIISDLEKRVDSFIETQKFVGDSMLDVIGDLERTVISCLDGDGHNDGNSSIVKLKELVRVLCGELSVHEFTQNCTADLAPEDVPRRRTGSAVVDSATKVAVDNVPPPPPPPKPTENSETPTRTRRQSSVSELLAQPDSDDDLSASPRPQLKKTLDLNAKMEM